MKELDIFEIFIADFFKKQKIKIGFLDEKIDFLEEIENEMLNFYSENGENYDFASEYSENNCNEYCDECGDSIRVVDSWVCSDCNI